MCECVRVRSYKNLFIQLKSNITNVLQIHTQKEREEKAPVLLKFKLNKKRRKKVPLKANERGSVQCSP